MNVLYKFHSSEDLTDWIMVNNRQIPKVRRFTYNCLSFLWLNWLHLKIFQLLAFCALIVHKARLQKTEHAPKGINIF